MFYTKMRRKGGKSLFNPYRYNLIEKTESNSSFYHALYEVVEDQIYYLGTCLQLRSELNDLDKRCSGINRITYDVRKLMENTGREFKVCFNEIVCKDVDISKDYAFQDRISKWAGINFNNEDEALQFFLECF